MMLCPHNSHIPAENCCQCRESSHEPAPASRAATAGEDKWPLAKEMEFRRLYSEAMRGDMDIKVFFSQAWDASRAALRGAKLLPHFYDVEWAWPKEMNGGYYRTNDVDKILAGHASATKGLRERLEGVRGNVERTKKFMEAVAGQTVFAQLREPGNFPELEAATEALATLREILGELKNG
jgi:uncharacterized membrane protein